jgi:carboxylesterase type B
MTIDQITLFGSSAGSFSASLLVEIFPHDPPFHGAIISSDVSIGTTNSADAPAPIGDFTIWNSIATHFGCSVANGTAQLECVKAIPANDLEQCVHITGIVIANMIMLHFRFTIDASLGFGPPSDGG